MKFPDRFYEILPGLHGSLNSSLLIARELGNLLIEQTLFGKMEQNLPLVNRSFLTGGRFMLIVFLRHGRIIEIVRRVIGVTDNDEFNISAV